MILLGTPQRHQFDIPNTNEMGKHKSKTSYQQIDESGSQCLGKQKKNKSTKKNHKAKYTYGGNDDYSFRQKVENNGERVIVEMAADGNCLFRSISHQLYNDHGQKHDVVRHEICNYLQDNQDDFKVYLLLEDSDDNDDVCDFDDYVHRMRQDKEWGGDVEIVCAARLYKRNITIFSTIGAYNINTDDSEGNSRSNMLLSYHDNQHYNSVQNKNDTSNANANQTTYYNSATNEAKTKSQKINKKRNEYPRDEETLGGSDTAERNENINDGNFDRIQETPGIDKNKTISKGPKKNDVCTCGSGLRYKKCCLAKEKNRIRLEKFREKHGIQSNQGCNTQNSEDSISELNGGFVVLNI